MKKYEVVYIVRGTTADRLGIASTKEVITNDIRTWVSSFQNSTHNLTVLEVVEL